MGSRFLRASVAGGVVGGASALLYRASQAPLLPAFMNDPATIEFIGTREAQTAKLADLLRESAPAIEAAAKRAEVACGTLDVRCRRARASASDEHTKLRAALRDKAATLTYGLPFGGAATAEDRDMYVARYGCVAWTDAALEAITARGGIVEVGAGFGHWARALRAAGADVLAYDDGSALPTPSPTSDSAELDGRTPAHVDGVTLAVDGAVAAARHPDRALLMVAPPPGPAAARWLGAYKGHVLLYAGEGRGGSSADEEFFAAIERGWRLVSTVALNPFPGGCEKLWVCERQAGYGVAPPPTSR